MDFKDFEFPEREELDDEEEKLLFKMLCENVAKLDLHKDLAPHGIELLHSLQRKLGINVIGVKIENTISKEDYENSLQEGLNKAYINIEKLREEGWNNARKYYMGNVKQFLRENHPVEDSVVEDIFMYPEEY
jgi:ribosomal protein L31E